MPAGLEIASCTAMFLGDLGLEQVGTLTGIVWVYVAMNWIDIGKMEIKGTFIDF